MRKRIRVDGVLYEEVQGGSRKVSPPKITKSYLSRDRSWDQRGSDVRMYVTSETDTNVFNGHRTYAVTVHVIGAGDYFRRGQMARLAFQLRDDDSVELRVETGRSRHRYLGRDIPEDAALGTVNGILSKLVSGLDFDDYDASMTFIRRKLTRAISGELSGDFDKTR